MILQGRLLINPHHTPQLGWVRIEDRQIAELGRGNPPETPVAGDADSLICPGFIDAHIHLPQIDAVGCDPPCGGGLLEWLDRIVFPAEMRWQDADVAQEQAGIAYRRMLRAGTLGYAGFLTSHFHSVTSVIRAGHRLPLRAIAGQVLMDRGAAEPLLHHRLARLANSKRGRIAISVNPRFAVGCSDELLSVAKARASDEAFVQTHLAESQHECELVAELFPNDPHYTGVYDRHGLLTDRTLLAHCVHLADVEWRLIAQRRSVVVHCPTANTFLQSGLFNLDAAREHGVRLALGSDVAAGPDLAMPRVARAMIEVAKMQAMTRQAGAKPHVPNPAEVWDLITRGNADALSWSDSGRLEVGAAADLLVLRVGFDLDDYLIGRLIYTWRDEYITHRVVDGRLIDFDPSVSEPARPRAWPGPGQPDSVA
ncbi:MAG: amidohydrolase family protein [Planctomycetes bacterium]|nr:amidohydrolase family protein [Planctomycetota bacterium]